jgi:hypothetical protein
LHQLGFPARMAPLPGAAGARTPVYTLGHLRCPCVIAGTRLGRKAALILERVKLYLADQFDRGDHPYVLPAEFATAGKTTCGSFHAKETRTPSISKLSAESWIAMLQLSWM